MTVGVSNFLLRLVSSRAHVMAALGSRSDMKRCDEKRLKQPFIGLDLTLQLLVFFRPEPRLARVRDNVVNVGLGPVGAEHRPPETALLQADNFAPFAADVRLHGVTPTR